MAIAARERPDVAGICAKHIRSEEITMTAIGQRSVRAQWTLLTGSEVAHRYGGA